MPEPTNAACTAYCKPDCSTCHDCGGDFGRSGPYACVCGDEPGDCCVDGDCTDCLLNAGLDPDCF